MYSFRTDFPGNGVTACHTRPVSPVLNMMPGTKQAFMKGTKASTAGKMPPAPRRALGRSGRARPRLVTLILPPGPLAQAFVLCGLQVLTLLMSRGCRTPPRPRPSHPQVHWCRRVGADGWVPTGGCRRVGIYPCSPLCLPPVPGTGASGRALQTVSSDTKVTNYLHREQVNYVFEVPP